MSDNWNQQPENNRQPQSRDQSNNSANQAPNPNSQNPSIDNSNQQLPLPSQPGEQGPQSDYSLQPENTRMPSSAAPPHSGSLQSNQQLPLQQDFPTNGAAGRLGFQQFDNALNRVRGWTNKVAAIAGHTVQPPAPAMDFYQPPSSAVVYRSPSINELQQKNVAKRSTLRRNARIRKISKQIRQRRIKKSHGVNGVIAIILIVLVAIIITSTSAGSAYGYSYYLQQQPRVQRYANEQLPQMTRIFDRNGTLLYEAYDPNSTVGNGGRRLAVRFQDIPKVMQDAMIAIEDKSFWTNDGVDPLAIIRAGASSYGGASTLTQQLIKNLSGEAQDNITRKINEAAMAIGMTQQYPKSKILEMYFNVAPFGSEDAGVEIAAQDYFGLTSTCQPNQPCAPAISKLEYNQTTKKNDPILALARASLLAGIPNSPVSFDPSLAAKNRTASLKRQKLVLQAMLDQKMSLDGQPLTKAMVVQAEDMTAKMVFKRPSSTKLAPSFVDYVINQVETALGSGNANNGVEAFVTGGYNIETTIDLNLNNYTQAAIQRHIYQPELQKAVGGIETLSTNNNVHNAAVVVEDSKTGELLAMVGSANYNSTDPTINGQYNAADSPRPPGSSFKPFDYTTAFEMGWNPGVLLQDTRTYFPNGAAAGADVPLTNDEAMAQSAIYAPYDYGQKYWERTDTARYATANSFNIPAIRAMQFAGAQNVLNTVHRVGITFSNNDGLDGLSWAIGSKDVSLLQMVGGYQTLSDQGQHITPQAVLNIWDNYGDELYHYDENKIAAARVFSPQVAYEMTSVLEDEPSRSFEFSGDPDLSFADVDPACEVTLLCKYEVAAKTGTTDNFSDNWTMGYSADAVVGVWVGNSDDTPMNNVIGITGAAPIWHSVMERVMGWCNNTVAQMPNPSDPYVYADNIPCGPALHLRFSNNPQWQFSIPSGISQSALDGLSSNAAQVDWMINGD
jgi:membrane peptidoglycan carboxypeptidase